MAQTARRARIQKKLRKTVTGTADRPRLAVFRSLNHLYAQLIDDQSGQTLAAASSLKTNDRLTVKAKAVGLAIAEKAKALKIKHAVYDRGGFAYRGAIKILCESARESGLTI